jgi:tetratricopeptide (TPR) repeat protein
MARRGEIRTVRARRPRGKNVDGFSLPGIQPDEIRAELRKILESPVFSSSGLLSDLLRYIVENAIVAKAEAMTEDALGVNVLGRKDYNSTADSHVRVEFKRLREKLREYYEELGSGDPIKIAVPKGSHVPQFKTNRTIDARRPGSDRALNSYLEGRRLWAKRTPEALQNAKRRFEHAIKEEPRYAAAHAALAECYCFMAIWGFPPREVMPAAKEHAIAALQVDETNPDAHAICGFVASAYEWKWDKAEQEFKKAIQLDPHCLGAYCWHASHLVAVGRSEEAVQQVRRAQVVDKTTSLLTNSHAAKIFYVADKDDQALELLINMLDEDPNFYLTHWYLGLVSLKRGQVDRAIASLRIADRLSGHNPAVVASLGYSYAISGQVYKGVQFAQDLQNRARLEYVPATDIAAIYAGLGNQSKAFEWLAKAYEERALFLTWLRCWPLFAPLRSDSRYLATLKSMGLQA